MITSQMLVDGFLKLPHDGRIRVCLEMGLVSSDDTVNVESWFILWKKAFRVIAEKNLHSKLWDALRNCGVVHGENPYEVAALVAELEWNISRGMTSRSEIEIERARLEADHYCDARAAGLDDQSKRERLVGRAEVMIPTSQSFQMSSHRFKQAHKKLKRQLVEAEADQAAVEACGVWMASPEFCGSFLDT